MRMLQLISWFLVISPFLFAANIPLSTTLTLREKSALHDRILRFYHPQPGKEVMSEAIPKADATTGDLADPNPMLKGTAKPAENPLLRQAREKQSPYYQKQRCQDILSHSPSGKECVHPSAWETARPNDQIQDLTSSWIANNQLTQNLDAIPAQGKIATPYWSSDYWRMKWGLTSYRYSGDAYYSTYKEAVEAYQQPKEWSGLVASGDLNHLAQLAADWSPSEKYDLLVGDEAFTLTNEQKSEGSYSIDESGDVPGWYGLCHGWAPASVFVATPKKTFSVTSPRGIQVKWYPDDVRALVTLAWSNGSFPTNFVGGRCEAKDPATYDNGRLKDESCFDTNPATFHAALGNLIGIRGVSFVMDSSYDYQVWNQPILSYEFKYFNPLNPDKTSKNWKTVAVAYDATFKRQDRFQHPLTRGWMGGGATADDSQVEKVVGVTATVVYLGETSASHEETSEEANRTIRMTYTYDLELHRVNGKLVALGGEWHENTHPDFLWTPQNDVVPLNGWDESAPEVDLDKPAPEALTQLATQASSSAYPLCSVIRAVVNRSSGTQSYHCQ